MKQNEADSDGQQEWVFLASVMGRWAKRFSRVIKTQLQNFNSLGIMHAILRLTELKYISILSTQSVQRGLLKNIQCLIKDLFKKYNMFCFNNM